MENQPLEEEPQRVLDDLRSLSGNPAADEKTRR
jgi:hypothetical protein